MPESKPGPEFLNCFHSHLPVGRGFEEKEMRSGGGEGGTLKEVLLI